MNLSFMIIQKFVLSLSLIGFSMVKDVLETLVIYKDGVALRV